MSPACLSVATLHHLSDCPSLPTSLASDLLEEASCRVLRAWAPELLHLHICQRCQGGQGVKEETSVMGFSPYPFPH